jgi:hypothetical protein
MTEYSPAAHHLGDEALVALLDGEALETERRADGTHLHECESCRARRDELAGAAALVAYPVEPLAEDSKNDLVLRALLAATAGGGPHGTGQPEAAQVVALSPRRKSRKPPGIRVAASLVIVAGLAAGAWMASRHAGGLLGSNGPAMPGMQGPEHAVTQAPILELRPVISAAPASCASVTAPDPGKPATLPDATYSPSDRQACLSLGPSLATLTAPAPTSIGGPAGLSGPDTLTVHFPAQAARQLMGLKVTATKGTGGAVLPDGQRLVAIGDGAVIGVVESVRSGQGASEVVVVEQVSPAVAEYLEGLLTA